jgi:hypothetical protein
MTYGRARFAQHVFARHGAAVSHLAELVRGDFLLCRREGPLIRPSATFSPRGEGVSSLLKEKRLGVVVPAAQFAFHSASHRFATG